MTDPEFKIINSKVVFNYETNFSIRKRVFEFEESLQHLFVTPFPTVPVPDNVDPNIPRFEANSTNRHSKLQVGPIYTNLITEYDSQFNTDYETIKSYLTERIELLSNLLDSEKHTYIGYVLSIVYELEEVNDFMKKNTGLNAIKENTVDIHIYYSFPVKNNYFLNIKINKVTLQDSEGRERFGIGVEVDINSKYSLRRGIEFNRSMFASALSTLFNIVGNNKLVNYANGDISI